VNDRNLNTSVLLTDEGAVALRLLGSSLVARFGLEYTLTQDAETGCVMVVTGHLDQGTRKIRLVAEYRADDDGRLWIFRLPSTQPTEPLAEAGSPDLGALVMRARKVQM
jgi:hypothetical protein